jgi:hypothetical protein
MARTATLEPCHTDTDIVVHLMWPHVALQANGGSWEAPVQGAVSHPVCGPPAWVWKMLQKWLPDAAVVSSLYDWRGLVHYNCMCVRSPHTVNSSQAQKPCVDLYLAACFD